MASNNYKLELFFLLIANLLLFSVLYPKNFQFSETLTFYYLFILFTVIAQTYTYNKRGFMSLLLPISLLAFVLCFRDYTGIDDKAYGRIFESVKQIGFIDQFKDTTMEVGFLFLYDVCSSISDNFLFAQFVCSFIPVSLIVCSFKKYEPQIHPVYAMLYFLCFIYFQMVAASLVRMFIAVSIVFFSLGYLRERKLKKFLLTIILAVTFHYSAGIMLVLSPLALKRNIWVTKYKFLIPFSTIAIAASTVLIAFAASEFLGDRYSGYATQESLLLKLSQFDTLPFLVYGFFVRKTIPYEEKRMYDICLYMVYLTIIISVVSSILSIGRIIFYFNFALIFLFSYWTKYSMNNNLIKLAYTASIIFYCYLYLNVSQFMNEGHQEMLFPYKNIFLNLR